MKIASYKPAISVSPVCGVRFKKKCGVMGLLPWGIKLI